MEQPYISSVCDKSAHRHDTPPQRGTTMTVRFDEISLIVFVPVAPR
jgi:hypothetical protein